MIPEAAVELPSTGSEAFDTCSVVNPSAQSTTSAIASLLGELGGRICVLLRDGRVFLGTLRTFDALANLVLEDCVERLANTDGPGFEDVPLGLYMLRGDMIAVVGPMAPGVDDALSKTNVRWFRWDSLIYLFFAVRQITLQLRSTARDYYPDKASRRAAGLDEEDGM